MDGGTGTPFVVVGALVALFVPMPAIAAVNRVVTVKLPPTAKEPIFVHERVPATRFVAFAPGVCETTVNKFVMNVSTRGTVSRVTLPMFVTVTAKTNCSPMAAGRPLGLTTVLVTKTPGATSTCGTLEVCGGTGIPLVVVGVETTTFVPIPEAATENRAVTIVLPPIAKGPIFVHEIMPAAKLVEFAGGACDTMDSRFVLKVSVSGTKSRGILPVFVAKIVNTSVSPIAAARFVGLAITFDRPMLGDTAECGTLDVRGSTAIPFVVAPDRME